jgi:hypothetical protein
MMNWFDIVFEQKFGRLKLHTNKIPLYPPLIKGEVKGDFKKEG